MINLAQKTLSGTIWHFSQQLVRRGINFIVTLILARYLVPADFGLVAMMAVFLALGASIMDSGFKQALIRAQESTQVDLNTAFYANLFLGVVSYGLLFVTAPLIASFYAEPKLIELIRVTALGVLINSFLVVQSAQMHQQLNFKVEMQTALPASIISSMVAIVLAYFGYGVWALIFQMLIFSLCNTLFFWFKQGWRPSLNFSSTSLRKMYSFGCKIFLSGILDIVFKNIYVVVIAKLFSATIAGQYFFAEKIKDMVINQLVSSIQTVSYPALVNFHNDDQRLKAGYRKVISITTFLLFPIMVVLAVLAKPVFELFLPEQWMPAIPYLQLLCMAGLLNPITSINLNLLKVKGRSDWYLYVEIVKKLLVIIVFFLSVQFGVVGIIVGQVISSVLIFLPNIYLSSRLIGYSLIEQISDFIPNLLLSFMVGVSVYYGISIVNWAPLVKLLFFGILSAISYLFVAHILRFRALMVITDIAKTRRANVNT